MISPLRLSKDYIFKDRYDGDLDQLFKKSKDFLNQSQHLNDRVERSGGLSSSSDTDAPHYWKETQPVLNWSVEKINYVWDYWGYPGKNKYIGSSWVNIHPNGGWTDEHTHGMTPLVLVVYIRQPKNGGNLLIFDPLFHHWAGGPNVELPYKEIEVQTGDVLIFPGWILHKTQPNQSNDDRIVMSVNIVASDNSR